MKSYKSSLCSDPRDKLYSLLGLAQNRIVPGGRIFSNSEWIGVDYSRTTQKLFECLAHTYSYHNQREVYGSIYGQATEEPACRQLEHFHVQRMQFAARDPWHAFELGRKTGCEVSKWICESAICKISDTSGMLLAT